MDFVAKAQAVLTAWDSSMSQARREEEQLSHNYLTSCHNEDVDYAKTERGYRSEETYLRDRKQWYDVCVLFFSAVSLILFILLYRWPIRMYLFYVGIDLFSCPLGGQWVGVLRFFCCNLTIFVGELASRFGTL